jgi:hypothetical protein
MSLRFFRTLSDTLTITFSSFAFSKSAFISLGSIPVIAANVQRDDALRASCIHALGSRSCGVCRLEDGTDAVKALGVRPLDHGLLEALPISLGRPIKEHFVLVQFTQGPIFLQRVAPCRERAHKPSLPTEVWKLLGLKAMPDRPHAEVE